MKNNLLILLLLLISPLHLYADEPRDSVWVNPFNGNRTHLHLLADDDTLVQPDHNLLKPAVETLGINLAVWAWDHYVYDNGWADVDIHVIRHNLKSSFVLDHDSYSGNQFSHPFHGSMFYNAARYHGHSYYLSALYPLIGSTTWEYFCETNLPAYNDFLSTGIGGTAIGEATHRVSDLIYDNSVTGFPRVLRELSASILNPIRGFHRIISGDMWHVSPHAGKTVTPEPYTFDFSVGHRHLHESTGEHGSRDIAFAQFSLDYGNHFDGKNRHQPFDYFHTNLILNLSPHNPTIGDLDIRGRLLSHQFSTSDNTQHDLALYQVYRYIDNYHGADDKHPGHYPHVNEACSFAVGLFTLHAPSATHHIAFTNDVLFDAIAFGGMGADYFQPRTYNFASGFSLRDALTISFGQNFQLGSDLYITRLYVPKGSPDPQKYGYTLWGDQGNNTILLNRSFMKVHLSHHLRFKAEHLHYSRHSHYRHHPNVHARSDELRYGLTYNL